MSVVTKTTTTLRFEVHYNVQSTYKTSPPQFFQPMLGEDERVVSVETFTDDHGSIAARVWIERAVSP